MIREVSMSFCFCCWVFKADDFSSHSSTTLFKVLTMSQACAALAAVGIGTYIRPDHALKKKKTVLERRYLAVNRMESLGKTSLIDGMDACSELVILIVHIDFFKSLIPMRC